MTVSLRADKISKSFKNRAVVNSVSFSVREGEVVGLLGPNGAGKTTSFYMVVGLISPQSGKVYFGDKDITLLPMHQRAQMGISYLPQSVSIFRKLTVRDNLKSIMQIAKIPETEVDTYVEELLEKFQIKHIENSLGLSLSGGERRRVEIARALIIKPKFLLLDEPFAGVDPVTVQEMQRIISQLKNEGLGILITDHNVRETLSTCGHAYVLSDGEIIAQGTPEEISNSSIVKDIYLGQKFKL